MVEEESIIHNRIQVRGEGNELGEEHKTTNHRPSLFAQLTVNSLPRSIS